MRRTYTEQAVVERVLYDARRPDLVPEANAATTSSEFDLESLNRMLTELVARSPSFDPGQTSLLLALPSYDRFIADREVWTPPRAGGALFVGTGFATRRQLGCALPFDITMTMIVADRLRRLLGLSHVMHLVADNHATANTFANPREVRRMAAEAEEDIPRVAAALGIRNYRVVLGSEVEQSPLYGQLLASVPRSLGHEYVRREAADIELARITQGAVVKLGWTTEVGASRGRRKGAADERLFDAAHRMAFEEGLTNVYTHPARNDDPARPRVAPYVMLSDDVRFSLRPSDRSLATIASSTMRTYLDHLAAAIELRLSLDLNADLTVPERVRRIQDTLFKPAIAPVRTMTSKTSTTPGRQYDLLDELDERGLVADCTDREGLRAVLGRGRKIRAYVGFDPTASSLHVGSLMPIAVMRVLQRHGHQPILLIGGATGMIGDPSGRSNERNLLPLETLDANRSAMRRQMERLLPGDGKVAPVFVDNRDWFEQMTLIEFLREVGKLAPVGEMLARRSVKARLTSRAGLSFTEFAYSLLQGYDFWHLRTREQCEIQFGGKDQWGNIVAGVDFMRRVDGSTGYGVVWPLLEKPDGEKFGKTAQGNIWLSAELTTRFRFHQYWVNQDDAIVRDLLLRFTARSVEEIHTIMQEHARRPAQRLAQRALANDVTAWVHGERAARAAEEAAAVLFSVRPDAVGPAALDLLEEELGAKYISRADAADMPLDRLACEIGLCQSTSDARRTIAEGGLYVDGTRVMEISPLGRALTERPYVLLRRGKQNYALLRIA